MPTAQLTLTKLHSAQQQIKQDAKLSNARFFVVDCGRRFGKDVLGIDLAIEPALQGYPVGWFNPTYKMLSEVWRELNQILSPVIKRSSSQERRIELITGGVIELWSLENPDSARGRKYKRLVVNEAAMVPKLEYAWQNVLRPTLTDFQGDGWFFSTPKGYNFFKRGFDYGQDPFMADWLSWQMPTSANPHIKPAEIESARLELPEVVFEQEYLAVFLETAGGVFRGVRKAVEPASWGVENGHKYVAGLDWGQQRDFTVIVVFDATTGKMVDVDRFNQVGWELQRGRVMSKAKQWNLSLILAEHNSIGGPNIEALEREGLPVLAFETTSASKGPLIESWALAIERGETSLLNDPILIAEHEAYERKISPITGRSSYSAPEGMHDDTVIAAALGYKARLDSYGFSSLDDDLLDLINSNYR
jgi:hypothetical protein